MQSDSEKWPAPVYSIKLLTGFSNNGGIDYRCKLHQIMDQDPVE